MVLATTIMTGVAHAQSSNVSAEPYVATPNSQPASKNPLPSSVYGNVTQPLSTQKLSFSDSHLQDQLNAVQSQVDKRMDGVKIGDSAGLKVPEIESDTSLKQAIDIENRTRYVKLRRAQVREEMGLWGEAYDGPREAEKSSGSQYSGSGRQPSENSGRNFSEEANKMLREKNELAQKLQMAKAEMETKQKSIELQQTNEAEQTRVSGMLAQARAMMAKVPPVVSMISGVDGDLQATILIPYVGEVTTQKGGKFATIDGRTMTVANITSDAVTIRDNGKLIDLNFGSSVPSPSAAEKITTAIIVGGGSKTNGNQR